MVQRLPRVCGKSQGVVLMSDYESPVNLYFYAIEDAEDARNKLKIATDALEDAIELLLAHSIDDTDSNSFALLLKALEKARG